MPCGWEGDCRSGTALAMRHRLKWFIHLQAHGLDSEMSTPPTLSCGVWPILPFTSCARRLFLSEFFDQLFCIGGAAAEWLSWGLVKGAEKTGQLVKYGSSKLRENIAPASQPSVIDPHAQRCADYAHTATHCAVRVSSFLGQRCCRV